MYKFITMTDDDLMHLLNSLMCYNAYVSLSDVCMKRNVELREAIRIELENRLNAPDRKVSV